MTCFPWKFKRGSAKLEMMRLQSGGWEKGTTGSPSCFPAPKGCPGAGVGREEV